MKRNSHFDRLLTWKNQCMMHILNIVEKRVLVPFTKQEQSAAALVTDARLRTVLVTMPGVGWNLVYAVFNGIIGVVNRSAWYGSLAAYYLLLCVMRFLAVSYGRKIYGVQSRIRKKQEECMEIRLWKVHRSCGIMFVIMSVALGGAVIMLVTGEGGKSYPGLMIYAVAIYTFSKLIISICNMVKARKIHSILLVTMRNISYADALVSLLSLQTALFAVFGQDAGDFVPLMNALTGTGVCLMIAGLGIYMIYKSKCMITCGVKEDEA